MLFSVRLLIFELFQYTNVLISKIKNNTFPAQYKFFSATNGFFGSNRYLLT